MAEYATAKQNKNWKRKKEKSIFLLRKNAKPTCSCIEARKSIKPKLIQNPSGSEIRSNYVGPLLVLPDLMQIEWRD